MDSDAPKPWKCAESARTTLDKTIPENTRENPEKVSDFIKNLKETDYCSCALFHGQIERIAHTQVDFLDVNHSAEIQRDGHDWVDNDWRKINFEIKFKKAKHLKLMAPKEGVTRAEVGQAPANFSHSRANSGPASLCSRAKSPWVGPVRMFPVQKLM